MAEMKLKSIVKKLLPNIVTEQIAGVRFRFKARFWKKIGTMTDEQFLNYVVAGYCKKHPEEHRENVFKLVHERENRSFETGKKRIVFVAEHVTGRLLKMASALHKCGWKIDFLCGYNSQYINVSNDDFKTCCERITYYDTFFELAYYLLVTDAPIVHYFTTWWSCFNACAILEHKPLFPKIVIERYDIISGMYKLETLGVQRESICECEKYALENADGICQREYSFEYLKNHLHYDLVPQQITFLDYYVSSTDELICREQDELSMCYVGGLITEKDQPQAYCACHLQFAKICERQRCHYHLYPSFWDEAKLEDYINEQQKNAFFHLHRPVPFSELLAEISQYDYGIFPVVGNYHDRMACDYGGYTFEKIIYAGTNKFFDYIAANLPIIAPTPIRMTKEMEKAGIALRWSIEEIDFDFLRQHKLEMKERVVSEKQNWSMETKIRELEDFYEKVKSQR